MSDEHAATASRRQWLRRVGNGFGALALAGLLGEESARAAPRTANPLAVKQPHFKARAKRVIFLFMPGGPSQVDTFDPKPRLTKDHGQPIKMKVQPTQFNNIGTVLQSPWKFRQHGQCGMPISDLFPHVASCADDLCVIRSMV